MSTLSLNPRLKRLHEYPFAKLVRLLEGVEPNAGLEPIFLTIGEPQHEPPEFTREAMGRHTEQLNRYPTIIGTKTLRESIANWIVRRYDLPPAMIDPDRHVLPVQGTREALFASAQFIVDQDGGSDAPLVVMPSPFYQIYEGAALMSGAEPCYVNLDQENAYAMNMDGLTHEQWDRCAMVFLCNPSNPVGSVLSPEHYMRLLTLAYKHDFIIASDECYSEIYFDENNPTAGLAAAAKEFSVANPAMVSEPLERCLIFNSLSKRSNLAGIRSGFVAGGTELIEAFRQYRTYHGSAMPLHHQSVSEIAWADEAHVRENRARYLKKMRAAFDVLARSERLDLKWPEGGFCFWMRVPGHDDEQFTLDLYRDFAVKVLPGRYLGRPSQGKNAGAGQVRLAMVQEESQCIEAANRIVDFVSK